MQQMIVKLRKMKSHTAECTIKEKKTFSLLEIACIPELTWGMRNCRKNNIPVVGIPLNANRCIRWFDEFFRAVTP
jgi:hypothetical protein